jgi:cold shock CspA family protein
MPPLISSNDMSNHGTVKVFYLDRGYGFIRQPGKPDVFVHVKVVQKYGVRPEQLEEGLPVRFLSVPDEQGRRQVATAIAVVP